MLPSSPIKKLLFIAFFAVAFVCCRKKNSPSPDDLKKRIAGSWQMHGTSDYSAATSAGYVRAHDTMVIGITIFQVDNVTILLEMNSAYTVFQLQNTNDTGLVFSDGADQTIIYNFNANSLFYHQSDNSYSIPSEKKLYSSPGHENPPNHPFTSNIAKVEGLRQWHGTYRTTYIPPPYTNLPDVDTTYYDTLNMHIYVLTETLILNKIVYVHSNTVWRYLVLKKTYEDQSTMVFTRPYSTYEKLTYYFANNNMFYFDSAEYGLSVTKYYTP